MTREMTRKRMMGKKKLKRDTHLFQMYWQKGWCLRWVHDVKDARWKWQYWTIEVTFKSVQVGFISVPYVILSLMKKQSSTIEISSNNISLKIMNASFWKFLIPDWIYLRTQWRFWNPWFIIREDSKIQKWLKKMISNLNKFKKYKRNQKNKLMKLKFASLMILKTSPRTSNSKNRMVAFLTKV